MTTPTSADAALVHELYLPNEQLSQAPLDGTVGVGALADVVNAIDSSLQGIAAGVHVT